VKNPFPRLDQKKKKPIDPMYPYTGVLMYRKRDVKVTGQIDWRGESMAETYERFPLWTDTAPADLAGGLP
jgi:hypothetical protein